MNDRAAYATSVEALECRRVAAMVAADIDTLDALLHDDVVFGHTDGHADTKATYIRKLAAGSVTYHDAEHRIENVRVFGDTALVTVHLRMRAELATGSRQLNVVALTVWTLDGSHWRLVAHHPTVVDV